MEASVDSFRPNRNFVRKGDMVRVTPSKPGKKDGFESKVHRIRANDAGEVTGIDVTDPHTGALRTLRPDRIERMHQPQEDTP